MLGLPKSTELKKQLPKAAIYKKFDMNTATKAAFDADISRLDIVAEVSPRTTALAAGTETSAFYVLLVTLKRPDIDQKNLVLLSKLIDQNLLFALSYENKIRLGAWHTRLMLAPWQPAENARLPLTGLNLDEVWQNILTELGGIRIAPGNTLDEQIAADDRRRKLGKQIAALETKMRREKQLNRQMEIHAEIKRLERERGEVK